MKKLLIGLLLASTGAHGAQLIEVHSGDTLTLLDENRARLRIRLDNIDAPEMDQPYGSASRDSLRELCEGKEISYELPETLLKAARKSSAAQASEVRAAVVCGGVDVGRAQLKRGMAWVRPYAGQDPAFTAIQDFVWREKTGLWADADPVPPWEWAERKK